MKISLATAVDVLVNASGIIFEDELIYPSIEFDLTGDPENQFMHLSWNDGNKYTNFNEGENQEVEVTGASMFLTDFEGDIIQITPLFPKDLENEYKL